MSVGGFCGVWWPIGQPIEQPTGRSSPASSWTSGCCCLSGLSFRQTRRWTWTWLAFCPLSQVVVVVVPGGVGICRVSNVASSSCCNWTNSNTSSKAASSSCCWNNNRRSEISWIGGGGCGCRDGGDGHGGGHDGGRSGTTICIYLFGRWKFAALCISYSWPGSSRSAGPLRDIWGT